MPLAGAVPRDLASGPSMNGSEQTAGAGEQTCNHIKRGGGMNPGWTVHSEVTAVGLEGDGNSRSPSPGQE